MGATHEDSAAPDLRICLLLHSGWCHPADRVPRLSANDNRSDGVDFTAVAFFADPGWESRIPVTAI
jgi:hypothetical protein